MMWNFPRSTLPNNYRSATKQFLSLETRLSKKDELKTACSDTIKTDEDSGYIRKPVTLEICDTRFDPQWHVPHHPVIIKNSVFEGFSLNKNSHDGPDLLQNLISIICRLRKKLCGMSADIEATFLQVKVRFIWGENQSYDLSTFEYTRHIFGPRIPLLVRTMLSNAQPRIMKTTFMMFRKQSNAILIWMTTSF